MEQVESFKFLGVHITNKLTGSKHTKTVVNRARQNLFPLFTIKSILTGCITAWYGNCAASDRKALQRVVRMAQYITKGLSSLPSRTSIPGGVRGRP